MADKGMMEVKFVADRNTADQILSGLSTAFSEAAITYNFLQDRVYPAMEERARRRFASGGDESVGGAWAALKPATQEIRDKGGFGRTGPINVRTGELKRHVLSQAPDVVPMPGGGTLYFPRRGGSGDVMDKMQTAQSGSPDPRTVPRPVVGVSAFDMELILVALGVHIKENMHGIPLSGF
jgi:hypothetical protein